MVRKKREGEEKQLYAKMALTVLHDLMLDTELTGNIRLQAANSLLDRIWGKCDKKSLTGSDSSLDVHKLEALSDVELLDLIKAEGDR